MQLQIRRRPLQTPRLLQLPPTLRLLKYLGWMPSMSMLALEITREDQRKRKIIKARPRTALVRSPRPQPLIVVLVRLLLKQLPFPLLPTSILKPVILMQLLKILVWSLLLTPCHGVWADHIVALKDYPTSQGSTIPCHSIQQFLPGCIPSGLLRCHT